MFRTRNFLPVFVAAAFVVALSLAGLAESDACAGDWKCWFIVPFKILFSKYDPPANANWLLNFAQQAGKAVLFLGALISSVGVGISAARHDFRVALARGKKRHIIVCGLGKTGMQVVQNLLASGSDIVVIDRVDDTANAALCDREGIPVIKGDAASAYTLRSAGVLRARAVVLCTGDDASNVDAALHIKNLAASHRGSTHDKLQVVAEMRDQWLYSRLVDHDQQPLGTDEVELQLFNTFDNASRLLVRSLRLPPGPEIDPGTLVIVGFGAMGQQVTLQMLRAAPVALDSKTKIIILDRVADERKVQFLHSYPAISDIADLHFVTMDISPDTPQVWDQVAKTLRHCPLFGVTVCLNEDRASLYTALNLRRVLDGLARIHVPIFLRLEQHGNLGQFTAEMAKIKGAGQRLQSFGGLEELLRPDILIGGELDTLAKALHAHWLASSAANGSQSSAARPWGALAETFKMANRRRADLIALHLGQAGLRLAPSPSPTKLEFSLEEIETLARLEHRRWYIDRRLLGVTYGEARSARPQRHPMLVEWERLPENVREANRNEVKRLTTILAEVKFEVQREHKILAFDETLGEAVRELESFAADDSVVVADIDVPEGRKVADLAIKQSNSTLWLLSREYPDRLPQGIVDGPTWEAAAGWAARAQLRRTIDHKR
jgi:TrkA-N domain/RyR domain